MNNNEQSYIPGVCNINREEIASRRKAGHFGLIIFIVLLAVFVIAGINRYYRFVLLLPALISAIGYLQARNRFCVGYAAAGQHNAVDGSTQPEIISDKDSLKADKHKTRLIYIQAVTSSILVTAASLLIPA